MLIMLLKSRYIVYYTYCFFNKLKFYLLKSDDIISKPHSLGVNNMFDDNML